MIILYLTMFLFIFVFVYSHFIESTNDMIFWGITSLIIDRIINLIDKGFINH
jgi:hypothetical protein